MLILRCSQKPKNILHYCTFQVDKHIRKLDSDLARFEAEIQDKAISATRSIEEGSQKRRCYFIMVFHHIFYMLVVFRRP